MRRGDKGEAVAQLQRELISLGYPLPRWGADGDLGDESLGALGFFLRDHKGAPLDGHHGGVVSDNELALVAAAIEAKAHNYTFPVIPAADFYDNRDRAGRAGVYGRRSWKDVTGICLHQTACVLGERPGRWDNVNCHVGVTRAGKAIWLHDFTDVVAHGNGWNNRCVGIEMDGLYAGVDGDPSTVWNDPTTPQGEVGQVPTPELVATSLEVVRWICHVVKSHGGEIKYLVAHRQSSQNRRDDPGSALWKAVALPLHAELGLTDGYPGTLKIGDGYAIPESWDPSRAGVRY